MDYPDPGTGKNIVLPPKAGMKWKKKGSLLPSPYSLFAISPLGGNHDTLSQFLHTLSFNMRVENTKTLLFY